MGSIFENPTSEEIRLGEMLDQFHGLRQRDASVGIGTLHEEAGELFPELADLAECLGVLKAGLGEEFDEIPAEIGPYVIEEVLGAGVSGTVYRAHTKGDDSPVALKVIRDTMIASPEGRARFEAEIALAQRLDHPNIARVVDHGEWEGRPYFAMELLEGGSLDDLLGKIENTGGKLPGDDWLRVLDDAGIAAAGVPASSAAAAYASRIAALFVPVGRALAHAARAGLVHRDIKPGNLLLSKDGRLVLTDFGMAKVFGKQLTSTVAVLGTPGYMSPEQASGRSREADPRCDVYGLGASLYRALTLNFPVEADSFTEMLAAILTLEPEPLGRFCAEYPVELSRVVLRSLEKAPEDRYADADVFADDLERVAHGRKPRKARLSASKRMGRFARKRRMPLAAAVAMLLLAVGGVWWVTRPAHIDVRAFPSGRIMWNQQAVGESHWDGQVARGAHKLEITRDRFHPYRESVELAAGDRALLSIHLRPIDPFDRETINLLAQSYEMTQIGDTEPPRARGGESDDPVPAPDDPTALAKRLEKWPENERERPANRLLVIQSLLDDALLAEAYAAARALSDEYPQQALPIRLCLEALAQLGLEGTSTYSDLKRRFREIEDG